MAFCNIPAFNLSVRIIYDISSTSPTVTIENTGTSQAGIKTWFELLTPTGVVYHQGSFASPDQTGTWTTMTIPEGIPQSNGHIEFNNAIPYTVRVYAQDASNNQCQRTYEDIICAPVGNKGKDNFGGISLSSKQLCDKGQLLITDTSNYLYQGIVGSMILNTTKFIYPADSDGAIPTPFTANNQTNFAIPIPVNGSGHELIRNSKLQYTFPTGNRLIAKYKYANKSITINCGQTLCSLMCGLTKYKAKLTGTNGTCSSESQAKINELVLDLAILSIWFNSPLCGYDGETLLAKVTNELLKNDCLCDDCGSTGNNGTTGLKCADIDIECVWDAIAELLTSDSGERDKFCTLVQTCITAANNAQCAQVFMSNVVFTSTKITVNFILPNPSNSTNLEVFYKLHSSGTWISAAVIASNSTIYDIVGTFTEGATYDVKVVNHCTGATNVDSVIVSGVIPAAFTACNLLTTIYSGLGDGVWAIEVVNANSGCLKYTAKKIDSAFVATLLPCPAPINFSVTSSGVLSWNGNAGNYEVSYKLKSSGSWTVFSTASYVGTSHSVNISGALSSSIELYDFRVILKCSGSDSLPVYTDYDVPSNICLSAGDFISFNESTGALLWYGGISGATYIIGGFKNGVALPVPTTYSISGTTSIITIDYSNIIAGLAIGDILDFQIKRDCSGGNYSDTASHRYITTGGIQATPNLGISFTFGAVEGDTITINYSGYNPAIVKQVQIEMRTFNGGVQVLGGNMMIVIDGSAYSQKFKSSIPLKTGDIVQFRFRTFSNCCDNYDGVSAWSSWFGTAITVSNGWDDVWKAVPAGWMSNSWSEAAAKYKIDKNGNFHFRGDVSKSMPISATVGTATGLLSETVLTIPSGIYNALNPNVVLASSENYNREVRFLATNWYFESQFVRSNNVFAVNITYVNPTSIATSVSHVLTLSGLSIE